MTVEAKFNDVLGRRKETKTAFARRAGVSLDTLCRIIQTPRKRSGLDTLLRIVEASDGIIRIEDFVNRGEGKSDAQRHPQV